MAQHRQRAALDAMPIKERALQSSSETKDDVMNRKEDIVSEILTHLPSSDLAVCMRVNRFWYTQASRHLYRNVTLDQKTLPSFLRGLGTVYDDIDPCRATMTEGIWKDCDHETAERLEITRGPRTYYNFKAPLLRYVQTLTLSSHHRCTCAASGPLLHRLLSNLKTLRVVRSVCGCPNSCAINALCDSASCPFLNCFADKYVFRNNDGDCGTAASSRMDRFGFLCGAEGRESRTTIVLPQRLGLLHNHGAVDIAFRLALERATSLKFVFADWEGCRTRPNAMGITLKDAKVIAHAIGDLLEGAPRCRKVYICGLEKVELAATRGGKASQIDEDDLKTLKKQILGHINSNIWIRRVVPDSVIHSHPHTADILFSLGSVSQTAAITSHANVNNNMNTAAHGTDEPEVALPGADISDITTLFGVSDTESTDGDIVLPDSEESDDATVDEVASDPDSADLSADSESDDGSGYTSTSEGSHEAQVDGNDETEQDNELDLEGAHNFFTALASGWSLLSAPTPGPGTSAAHPINSSTSATTAHASAAAADSAASSPGASGAQNISSNSSAPSGSGQPSNPPSGTGGMPAAHLSASTSQSLLAAFQDFVTTISRVERTEGQIIFKSFEEYVADEDSRGELSLE